MDPATPAPGTPSDDVPVSSGGGGPRGEGLRFNFITSMVGGKIGQTKMLIAGGFRDYITVDNKGYNGAGELVSWHYTDHTTATLFWSSDGGKTWTEAACPVTDPGPALHQALQVRVWYLAFDPKAKVFYADVQKDGAEPDGTTFRTICERHLIQSFDGKKWESAAVERRDLTSGAVDFISPFLQIILGIANNGLTEIIDEAGTAKLTYTTIEVQPGAFGGGIKLEPPWKVEDPTHAAETFTIRSIPFASGRAGTKGIACSGGKFLIAGSLIAGDDDSTADYTVSGYTSTDQGKTWTKTLTDSTSFTTFDPYSPPGIGCAGSCGCAGA
jgi:hypothetical protein